VGRDEQWECLAVAVHVERATLEDLTDIWELHGLIGGAADERQAFVQAVENRECLVAKAGWAIRGYAVRRGDFLGYPLLTHLVVHPDYRKQGVARALVGYAERTMEQDRVFAVLPADYAEARSVYGALGFSVCGAVSGLMPGQEAIFFVKYRSQL
jgi:ribosomal protein S18 acetylase RimI-like enzyme